MKTKLWLMCGMTVCATVVAQQATNAPSPGAGNEPAATTAAPPPATPDSTPAPPSTPAKKAAKSPGKKTSGRRAAKGTAAKASAPKASRPPAAELRTVPLKPGPAVVVANHVNVRGQGRLKGEVLGHLTKGQPVTVIEEITLSNSAADEPSAWAKIALPEGCHTWINAGYIDASTKAVKARRLNVRGGPGENYSVIGRIEQGQEVKEVGTKGDWIEIEPPPNCFAFVAAQYLQQETGTTSVASNETQPATTAPTTPETATQPPSTAAASTEPPATPPTTSTVNTEPPVAAPATDVATPPANTAAVPPATTAAAPITATESPGTNVVAMTETKEAEEPPPPRIVSHEGIVRGTASIQAPTRFELFSPDTGRAINYLYSSSRELDLSRYKGLRIIVTGEEGLDERWRNTPVLTIERIQVLE